MGESQCSLCHHIVTGFEQIEFEISQAKDAEIERLKAELATAQNR